MIPVYKPYRATNTKRYVESVVDSNWFSSGGYFYDAATEQLCSFVGSKHVLLLNNGTTATHLVSKALSYKLPELEEVVVQNSAYAAAWNSFLFDGNKTKLTVVDVDLDTWNYSRKHLDATLNIRDANKTGLLVVHSVGNPFEVSKDCPFVYVEDNCEGFIGTYSDGKQTGTKALAASISFFANKNVTSGEGGASFISGLARQV